MYEAGGKADSAPFAMPNAELIAPTKLYLPLFRLTYSGLLSWKSLFFLSH